METIMVGTPWFVSGNNGNYIIKAISESRKYRVIPWDFRVTSNPPTDDYDFCIIQKGENVDPSKLKNPILIWTDDPSFPGHDIYYKLKDLYEECGGYVADLMHYPLGTDSDIHKRMELNDEQKQYYGAEVTLIGTLRDRKRLDFINKFRELLPDKYSFKIWGNGWHPTIRPVYFQEFNLVCNASRVIINQHISDLWITTKDIQVPACGGGLMINDKLNKLKEMYGFSMPQYKDVEDAVAKTVYYLENEKERQKKVDEMYVKARKYSFKNQIKKIIGDAKEKWKVKML